MVFIISVAVVGLMVVIGTVQQLRYEFGPSRSEGYGWFVVAGPISLIMLMVIGIGSTTPPGIHAELLHRYGLHALVTKDSTNSQIEGSFFLGFGGVEGSSSTKTKIVYIETGTDGGSTIHDTTVGRSVIYE